MACCQFLLAQLSLLNSAFTCALTFVGSPVAVCQLEVPLGAAAGAVVDALGVGVAAADGVALADGVADGEGLALAAATPAAASPPVLRALRAISATPLLRAAPRTKALVDALGEAFAEDVDFGVALADGLGDPLAVELGVGVGVVVGVAAGVFGASSSTWRNSNSAVCSTSFTTACDFWPGTETSMMLVPCGTTVASVKPPASTRLSMIWTASFMSCGDGVLPCGASAFRATWVPLVRSRPR